MVRIRILLTLAMISLLVACTGKKVWAPDDAVTKATYSHDAPPSITLVTVINNHDGSGGHSALVINAHQRVVFDPAGNYKHELTPERNDFVYGMTPRMLQAYYGFHARTEWHVITQEIEVEPEISESVFQSAKNNGAVASAYCANSVSAILSRVPGFESVRHSLFPKRLMADFAELPGVKTETIFEYD